MADRSQSSRFRLLFESALQEYQKQTGTTLASHPLAEKLQDCDSIESVTAVLHEQARAFREFRDGDGRVMKSLEAVVSVVDTLSVGTVLGEAIGLVRWTISMGVPDLRCFYYAAIPACKGHICWHRHPSRRMTPHYFLLVHPSDMRAYQVAKDVGASYDALVDLLESIAHFVNRLDIYTRVPSTTAMTELIVKIMVELISTLTLVTKQIKQKRPSTSVLTDIPLV
jgi:hypothetical protein